MNQLQLYINDQLVDLNDDSPIALTFQINNLAEVQNQQGNTSNQFKLPLTQRNRIILGFPDDIALTTNQPYQQYQAKLVQDGLEIIPYGIAELNNIEQDNANITILSGNVDFFDAIDGKLYDMGDSTSQWTNMGKNLVWQSFDHKWNINNIATSQVKTDGWIYPIVDYGYISGDDFTQPIDVHKMRPGFFIKTAIDLLLKSAGYKGKGSLLNDTLYPLLICQFANDSWEHGTNYQNQKDIRGLNASDQNGILLNHPDDSNPGGVFNWNNVTSDPQTQFTGQLYTSVAPNSVKVTAIFPHVSLFGFNSGDEDSQSRLEAHIYYRDPNYPSTPDLSLADTVLSFDGSVENMNGNNPKGWLRQPGTSGGGRKGTLEIMNTTLSVDADLPQNGGIYVAYVWKGRSGSWARFYPGSTLVIESQNTGVLYGQTVQCERIFPDISQKDLLKDTLQRFGIICQTDNASRTVSFNSLRDIVNNIPVAKNWSSKCVNQGKQVAFRLGNYAQINYMKYKEDDAVLPIDFANAQINIADTTLPAIQDLFQSQFAPTLNRPFYGGTIAQILKIDPKSDSADFSLSTQPRMLVDQKFNLMSIGKTITLTDGNSANNVVINDWISVPYFYKPNGDYNLCFGDMPSGTGKALPGIKTKYYPELQKVLQQTKKVICYMLLTPRDILELDLIVPIYLEQDSAYYYINKIDSWRKGQPCKVELVKL